MRVSIYNDGDNAIRVIIDSNALNELTLDSGEERVIESRDEGVIELRELAPGDVPGSEQQSEEPLT
ncbi:hypothetical protein [Paraburkholderia silvatlantica]|uniref:hypothetical protein n=1 Tax=Paraburkholderia silvatlantica TaxID=321895 RepID=UPI003750B6E4